MTEWLIAGNPKKYNVVEAFHKLKKIDWVQNANMEAGDIVYIYVSGDVKAIQFKCRANKVNIETPDIDDHEFDVSGQFDGSAGRYMELEMIEEFIGDAYKREELMKHGFKSPMGPVRLPESVKTYLNSLPTKTHAYGKFNSWTIVDEVTAIKKCDKSFFEHRGSGVPADIRWFFDVENLANGKRQDIEMIFDDTPYDAHVERESSDLGRTRIFWSSELAEDFASMKPEEGEEYPELTFKKIGANSYKVNFGVGEVVKKYTVNQAIWIAAALLSAEVYENNPDAPLSEYYFKQAKIVHRAQPMADKKVDGARCSWWCCADQEKKANNYLRGDLAEDPSPRRLTRFDEFDEKTHPDDLDMSDVLIMNGHEITMEKLFYFVENQYPEVFVVKTDINYISVLEYLEHNQEVPYSNPEAATDPTKKQELLDIKKKGQEAVAEMKRMAAICSKKYNLTKVLPGSWLDGSNTKTRKYLWTQMKYEDYKDSPISISIFVELGAGNKALYRISLETKNDNYDKAMMAKYHSQLDLPLNQEAGLVYVAGSNEWDRPAVLTEDQATIKAKVENGDIKKVQICKCITQTADQTNEYFETEILKAVKVLVPYYEHVLGIDTPNYWPSLSEYDPGITKEMWVEILGKASIISMELQYMLKWMYELGGESTCANLEKLHGNSAAYYNRLGTGLGQKISKEYGIEPCDDDGKKRYFPIPFVGRYVQEEGQKRYSWKLRDELYQAIKELGFAGDSEDEIEDTKPEQEETIMKVQFDKNMILYGPPGTGKTYNTAIYAVAICQGRTIDDVASEPYSHIMYAYDKLKKENRVAFTTFHQSYGYEEFIEGIKPVVDGDKRSNELGYKIEAGIFKSFCESARQKEIKVSLGDVGVEGTYEPKVWHVLLDGTGKTELKKKCFEDGEVRISFHKITDEQLLEEDCDITENARYMIEAFQEEMQIGDFVVTCSNLKTIDGIAIITGDYEYDPEAGEFPRRRTVKWLAKDVAYDVLGINDGKQMTRDTVLQCKRITAEKLLHLIGEDKGATSVGNVDKNYVFIIDEINRGNISKIFGELITLIEDTKREGMDEAASAILPYSGDPFSVPKNVYILGTMNTADRSIALMDTALRRRFQFVEMMPSSKVLRKIGADKVGDLDVAKMLDTINERITFLYDREHTIGHAFFTKLAKTPTVECLKSIFEKSVIPLLQEYFYEDYQKIQLVLGDNGKSDPSHKFILDEEVKVKSIFKGNAEDVVDLPEKKYTINEKAFEILDSYKEIM